MWQPWILNNSEKACASSIQTEEYSDCFKPFLQEHGQIMVLNCYRMLLTESGDSSFAILRTSHLLKVSIPTIKIIIERGTSVKKRVRHDSGKSKMSGFVEDFLRRRIYEDYQKNIVNTTSSLQQILKNELEFDCSNETVRQCLRKIGFRFKKLSSRNHIMEIPRLVTWRIEYLNLISKFRAENRFIVYLDETWFDTHDTVPKGWVCDEKQSALNVPPNRGKRIIILHAGSENGWVNDCLMISAKNIKNCNADYHEDMTSSLFENWFKTKLIPQLPQNSVIVMDNASYHSRQEEKIPNKSSKKCEMISFLEKKNISMPVKATKEVLYNLIKENKFSKEYVVDNIATSFGHTVLRLPPYHCVFNPIELIWSRLKGSLRKFNSSPNLSESVINLLRNATEQIDAELWKNCVNHVKKIELEYLSDRSRGIEQLIINVNSDNSDSDDSV